MNNLCTLVLPTALKRSFDTEDVEAIESIPTATAASVPTSPPDYFLHRDKANEKQKGRSLSFAFSHYNNNSLVAATQDSQSIQGSNSSLVPKSHPLIDSLSFNRGSANKPSIHNHNASVIRAASFQGRSNPNTYSTAIEQGSDNDSLYSSSSSLDYTAGWGSITLTKPGLHSNYLTQKGYNRTMPPKFPQQLNKDTDPKPRKSSSHGTVFHSEISNVLPRANNTGFIPSLDLQCQGGVMVDVQCGRDDKCTNSNVSLNGKIHNAGFLGEEIYTSSKNYNQQESVTIKRPLSRTKETPTRRLNKFPLDLDRLVSSPPSITPSTEAQREPLKPQHPKLLWSYSDSQNQITPPSTSVSPSASLSSLDSSSDTPPPLALHYPFLPFAALSSSSPSLQLDVPPKICHYPLAMFADQTSPEQQISTRLQDVVPSRLQHTQSHEPSQSMEDSNVKNSLVTQSTASSESVTNKATSTACTLGTTPLIKSTTNWKEEMKKQIGKWFFSNCNLAVLSNQGHSSDLCDWLVGWLVGWLIDWCWGYLWSALHWISSSILCVCILKGTHRVLPGQWNC